MFFYRLLVGKMPFSAWITWRFLDLLFFFFDVDGLTYCVPVIVKSGWHSGYCWYCWYCWYCCRANGNFCCWWRIFKEFQEKLTWLPPLVAKKATPPPCGQYSLAAPSVTHTLSYEWSSENVKKTTIWIGMQHDGSQLRCLVPINDTNALL